MQAHVLYMLDCFDIIQIWHVFVDAMSKTDDKTQREDVKLLACNAL